MANAPDEKLVRRAQKGDKAAFAELFTRYEGRIFGYIYRMVGDRAWAEDIAQEAFIQAHQYLNRLGPPYDFKSWVYRIAGNLALDGLRRYRQEVPLPDWDGGEATAPEPADQRREGAPEDQAGLSEVRAAVWRTIHQLPDNYRQILVLREIDGLAYNEIAAVLDLSLDNVRVTLHRARLQFRDLYELQAMVEEGRMACQELDDLLSAYLDDELDRSTRKRVKDHIKTCPACQKKRRDLLAAGGLLAALVPVFPPLTLRTHFFTRLQHLPPPEPAPSPTGGSTPPGGTDNQPLTGKGGGGLGGGGEGGPWLLAAVGGGFAILLTAAVIIGGLFIVPRMGFFALSTSTPVVAATDTPPPRPTRPALLPTDTSTTIPPTPAPTSTARPTHTPTEVHPTSTPVVPTPVPTRTPSSVPSRTPSPTPTHTTTPTPPSPTLTSTPAPFIEFTADANTVPAGTCTTVRWKTAHVQAVYFDGNGVPGEGLHQTCPCTAETHTLDVTMPDGSHDAREITIHVTGSCVSPTPDTQGPPAPTSLTPSDDVILSCRRAVILSWDAVKDPSGVAGYYVRLEKRVNKAWEPVGEWGPLDETQTGVPAPSCGLGYRWAVRARDGAGNLGLWSPWATFGIGVD
ncbi:MAG: sigma-70 family RNA polymerase sigma factor [Anaerolineae bacterium]|nr:sigma-70 family RNA polymerase sigma factor [Anaerolineae bacterium]